MRILYYGNNAMGCKVLEWLKEKGEHIAGLVAHPAETGKFRAELLSIANVSEECVFDGSRLREPSALEAIRSLKADIGVSVYFAYILRRELLDILPFGCINLHPSMLPYNRGAHPNVWSIVDKTPAGATLHYLDSGVDTGDIIAQEIVPIEPIDTGATLYRKLEEACFRVFCKTWPAVKAGATSRVPQSREAGSSHKVADLRRVEEIQLDRNYQAGELLDILRARTFPPYTGAYFLQDGRKVYVNVELRYADEP